MYNLSNNKQLTKISYMRLGSHEEQHLLFSLVHLILCYQRETNEEIVIYTGCFEWCYCGNIHTISCE